MVKIFDRQPFLLQIVFVILFQNAQQANGGNFYTELETLKPEQRSALAEFKKLVTPILPHDYMKEDIYLVKFLSYNSFKLPKAEQQLKEMLKWRQENNVDELLTNPPASFAALQNEYPIYLDGYDKEDRPICEAAYGSDWSFRKAATAGIGKQLILHVFVNCVERATKKIREQQALGKNVSQYISVLNMDGFSTTEHACPACIPILLNVAVANDKYYPNYSYGNYLINTPASFASLFRIVRPALSPSTRATIKVFTSKESEWKPFLEKRVNFKEISHWYGGAKDRKSL